MKLHGYLEQVIGNKTAVAIVRVLLAYHGKIFTIRGLAEAARVSPSEASLVAKQLEEARSSQASVCRKIVPCDPQMREVLYFTR